MAEKKFKKQDYVIAHFRVKDINKETRKILHKLKKLQKEKSKLVEFMMKYTRSRK